jgi:poly-gamma-glutamate capsule biosynthesis protein CapA/YwtB (metallophosphatase superfamily)
VQPVEKYGEGVIFYSLGNLIFDQFHRRETQRGLLSEVTFRGKWLERVELRDVEIPRGAPQLFGLPSVFLERPIAPASG